MTTASTQITSKVSLLSKVLCSASFTVPWHQRYYDWQVTHVENLLTDIRDAHSHGKTCYFLGSIMLAKASNRKAAPRILNDGQQRLITLSILIAALSKRFAQKRNPDHDRVSRAMQALFCTTPSQNVQWHDVARYHPRIKPHRINKTEYNQIIIGNNLGADGLLADAQNKINEFVKCMNYVACKDFFDFLMYKVEISVLNIPDDVDANLVFESLNARGKPLDSLDLIRNRLYSYFPNEASDHRLSKIHSKIEGIPAILRDSKKTNKKTEEYYRCYFQCNYGHIKKTKFYRQVKDHVEAGIKTRTKTRASENNPSNYVYQLIENLGHDKNIELFRAINSGKIDLTLEQHLHLPKTRGTKRTLSILLNELRPYTVSHPLVFALLYRRVMELDPTKIPTINKIVVRSLTNLVSFVMRTAFIAPKFEPSRFEMEFANCAKTIFKATSINSLCIYSSLLAYDPYNVTNNSNFIRHLAERDFDSPKARRCLLGINSRQDPSSDAIKETACSVEHILPKSKEHWKSWAKFTDSDAQECVHRIGNLTIVPIGQNKSSAKYNQSLTKKLESFESSPVHMTRSIAKIYSEWTPAIVKSRSLSLAKEAAEIWKLTPPRKQQ